MKKFLPAIVTGLFALWVIGAAFSPKPKDGFDLHAFGALPVVLSGRIQPLDSVARNSLLVLRGKQSVALEGNQSISAIEWLAQLSMTPEKADDLKVFQVTNPDLKGMFGFPEAEKNFSLNQLRPEAEKLQNEAKRINEIEAEHQSPYERQASKLFSALINYRSIKYMFKPEQSEDYSAELAQYESTLPAGVAAVMAQSQGKEFNKADLDRIVAFLTDFDFMSSVSHPLSIPPSDPSKAMTDWANMGSSLKETVRSRKVDPVVKYYASMVTAYRAGKPDDFNRAVGDYTGYLKEKFPNVIAKCTREVLFNDLQTFYHSMVIYVLVCVLAFIAWLRISDFNTIVQSASYLAVLAFVVHTVGLVARMALEGRPPVTNLYSSAIFIGWAAALLGLILNRIYRDGIGLVVSGGMGFCTLLIAHHLAMGGDTMEMMRAVLDSNFWLATHVVTVTLGYAATFFAGFLGILYITRGFFTTTMTKELGVRLGKMMYGIVCFAALFSFVGTVLGGIWADQSWGRFWGWDPKENGAVIIVLWNAVILHARWGGIARERGIAAMTVFGNIVTSFSWFGVNMLGVGLHAYGFMDKAFFWLMAFDVSQIVLIVIAMLPLRMWGSSRGDNPPSVPPGRPVREEAVAAATIGA